ncbi:hypothetical protein ANOM_002481 [Aspergillus nomiae NRRL 13137]|uniref:Zinc finger PHD-type domain-containing protein n=1 Tax=Aspergillus nomiae NRRL (strain ATCC 15546 / NRRL 13137 / CBS 260.88 / M93) TaxID=1509407 RepID=A0A0L1JAS9_ASPN3|nr:uncharacterized protein ANOM_002481 [Aspergillus nomiae NRRL 13137]KNG88815.1 hypothetical protein ANOM_002481 [Aspergillus nomiae NRRL 13137]
MQSAGVKKVRARRNKRGPRRVPFGQTGVINQEQSQDDSSNVPIGQSRISWPDTLAALEKESLDSQIHRHKEWKRNGSIHEDYCRVCWKSHRLEPCMTCRLALHSECMPAGWLRNAENQLFCAVCVRRGWHVAPPTLTAPASPRLAEGHGGPAAGVPAIELDSISVATPCSHAAPLHGQPQASSTHEQSISDRQDIPATAPVQEASPNNKDIGVNGNTQPGVSRPPRQRKSRYISLRSEVDTAFNVLYREVEASEALRLENENLRNENARCIQTIQIRDLSLMAMRRELEHRRFSDQDLERLQASAAQLEHANRELQELRAKNESLEAELQVSRESAKEVQDWKAKFVALMNT